MTKQVRVRNIDELARALKKHGLDVQAGLRAVVLAGAEVYREGAAARAPVRTGVLADSILIGDVEGEGGRVRVPVGPSKEAFYGRFQEFGTTHHGAQPFMRPAMDESGDRILAAARRAAEELLP